jgi:hypothetical protein
LLTALAALPRPILVRVLRALLPMPPEATHIEAISAFVQRAQPHAALSLPGCTVCVEGGRFCVQAKAQLPCADYAITLREGENPLPDGIGVAVLGSTAVHSHLTGKNIYRYETRLSFSSATIKGSLVLRPRRAGERILCGGKHKLVRRLGCMAPFSLAERARMPLLCDDEGVVAVPFGPLRDGSAREPDLTLLLFFN